MNRLSIRHGFVFFVVLLLLSGVFTVGAQDEEVNLLTNGGFETPYVDAAGNPARQVATGWEPWHVPRSANMSTSENTQPEYAPTAPDVTRIRSDDDAQKIFTSFFTFDGGVYQEVSNMTAGTEVRFSVYAYVWSSSSGDPERSDDPAGVLVQVGIDPNGGTDGESDDIIWSSTAAANQYDAYRQYAVIADVTSSDVTVFVRITMDFPVADTVVYLDDAVLALTPDSPVPVETEDILPTETELPTETPLPPEPTATEVVILPTDPPPPTDVVVILPTATDVPTETELPTETSVPVEPTATEVVILPTDPPPPTDTPTLVPTSTTEPSATLLPTNTAIPQPTNTPDDPTPTQEGGGNPTAIPQPTITPLPNAGNGGDTDSPVVEETQETGDIVLSPPFLSTITHTVQRGDTVGYIATLYGSDVDAIIDLNGLNINGLIFVEQRLIIPVQLPAAITATPTITPEVQEPVDGAGGGETGSSSTYTVQVGDTLSRIALRFNTTVATLVQLNGITNPNIIRVGQVLNIPAGTGGAVTPSAPAQPQEPSQPQEQPAQPQTHTVVAGENLYRIALRYGVTLQALADANGIANVNRIFAGQVLVIP